MQFMTGHDISGMQAANLCGWSVCCLHAAVHSMLLSFQSTLPNGAYKWEKAMEKSCTSFSSV